MSSKMWNNSMEQICKKVKEITRAEEAPFYTISHHLRQLLSQCRSVSGTSMANRKVYSRQPAWPLNYFTCFCEILNTSHFVHKYQTQEDKPTMDENNPCQARCIINDTETITIFDSDWSGFLLTTTLDHKPLQNFILIS